jgi:hypothetical protein
VPTGSVILGCADCGRLLAEYQRVELDPERGVRVEAHARTLLGWHRAETATARWGSR